MKLPPRVLRILTGTGYPGTEDSRQRWQAPDVPAELAKRVICACIREICFFRFSMGPNSHKFSTSVLTRHLYTGQLVSAQSEVINFRRQF